MTARAAEAEVDLVLVLRFDEVGRGSRMERIHGTPNASVLPEPVSATPTTSRLERRKGQAADWIGVGALKPVNGEGV